MKPISIKDRFIIINDFYTDPVSVRNYALNEQLEASSNGNYSGKMSNNPFLTKEHLDAFSELVGFNVVPSTGFTGKFRFTKKTDESAKQYIHFDPGDNNCCLAGVWYGSQEFPENTEGTTFWKHNRTGLESIPLTLEGLTENGWSPDTLKEFLDKEGIDESYWTKTMSVPYRFNRLALFSPWLFHAPGPAFGTCLEDSRLVQTFFLSPQ